MTQTAGERATAMGRDVSGLSQRKLTELGHEELRRLAIDEVARAGCFTAALAERLDTLFRFKVVRLLRSSRATTSDFHALDDLIASLSRQRFASDLAAGAKRHDVRWRMLREMLAVACRMDGFDEALREVAPTPPGHGWEFVAEQLVGAEEAGIAWSIMAERLIDTDHGPKSKSGVSQLLTAMRASGWIESVAQGRTKRLHAGPRIHLSQAWRRRHAVFGEAGSVPAATPTEPARPSTATEVARRIVCFNQGAYVDYSFRAHEYHRRLREPADPRGTVLAALGEVAKDPGVVAKASKVVDAQRVYNHTKRLIEFLDGNFKAIARRNFSLLQEHFAGRSEWLPRMCVKGNWDTSPEPHTAIASIIRDQDSAQKSRIYMTQENTGFHEVVTQGRYYLNQDIAKQALLLAYKNPRLDPARVLQLRERVDLGDLELGRGFKADEWLRCWSDWKEGANTRDYYRSTLIVPMTLRNNNLSDEFVELIEKRHEAFKLSGYHRSILGFLCFDHPQAGFFNAQEDVSMGYMVADLLSLYTFTRIALTTLSTQFAGAMSARKVEVLMKWIDQQFLHGAPGAAIDEREPMLELVRTNANQVINLATRPPIHLAA